MSPTPLGSDSAVPDEDQLAKLIVSLAAFEVGQCVSTKSFCRVTVAINRYTRESVAIKTINNPCRAGLDKQMFIGEVLIHGSFNHSTLLGFRGYAPESADKGPSILIEFMSNGTLAAIVKDIQEGCAPPKWDDRLQLIVLYDIAVGLVCLHRHPVMHRDLRPDNIFQNDAFEPKIAGFGLSKLISREFLQDYTINFDKPCDLAPELHLCEDGSFPVDVYAYGMLMYTVLTGRQPFAEYRTAFALGQAVCRNIRPALPTTVPDPYRTLIQACWAQSPDARPTFNEIVKCLEQPDFGRWSMREHSMHIGAGSRSQKSTLLQPQLNPETRQYRQTVPLR